MNRTFRAFRPLNAGGDIAARSPYRTWVHERGGTLTVHGNARFVAPDKGRQRSLTLDQFPGLLGVVDDRFDLAAMADDAFVFQESLHIAKSEARDLVEIKAKKRGTETFAFDQYCPPAQAGLKTLEA